MFEHGWCDISTLILGYMNTADVVSEHSLTLPLIIFSVWTVQTAWQTNQDWWDTQLVRETDWSTITHFHICQTPV